MNDERVARAGLTRLVEPADHRVVDALAQAGASRLYEEILLRRAERGLSDDAAGRVGTLDPARDLERAARAGIRFVIPGDAEWPTQLDTLAHSPAVSDMRGLPFGLWVRGPLPLHQVEGALAVVGSRSSTTYGETAAREIGAGMVRADRVVVSGAAVGIDQAAHRGALGARGSSIAVLACGVDRAYPAAHRELLDHLARTGAVVSELPPGCAPMRMRFLARNRLIAGLSKGTVVVEAALRSGALNTASWTESLSRPLMGVPGPVSSAQSQGVHHWIRSGAATLVTGPADVLEVIGDAGSELCEEPRGAERPRDRLSTRHRRVLEAVPLRRPAPLESIAATAGIDLVDTQGALTSLARGGFVVGAEGGWRLGPRATSDLRGPGVAATYSEAHGR